MQITRRQALATIGGSIALCFGFWKAKPIAYIVVDDTMYRGKINRGWHVFWAHHEGGKEKYEKYDRRYCKNRKELIIYDHADFPVPVKEVVDQVCPLAPPLTSYDQFHVFRVVG